MEDGNTYVYTVLGLQGCLSLKRQYEGGRTLDQKEEGSKNRISNWLDGSKSIEESMRLESGGIN